VNMARVLWVVAVAGSLVVTAPSVALAQLAPTQKCEAAKNKAAGKDASCRAAADAKAILGDVLNVTKCSTRLASSFAKAESKGLCATTGDATSIDARVDRSTRAIAALLNPASALTDNGDGTISDPRTGLQWERKVPNVCSGATVRCTADADCIGFGGTCLPCLNCVNDIYTWSQSSNPGSNSPMDGTVATAFLSSLNGGTTGVGNCTSTDGVTQTGGFAGHCDWRLPTVAELKSLFEVTDPSCIDTCSNGNFIGVCDDPTLGPLRTCGPYWTSTSVNPVGGDNSVVWGVGVDPDPQPPLPLVVPFLVEENKYASTYVRAVRGGY